MFNYTPCDSVIPSVGGDSDLKSTEPWFSKNLPKPQILKNGILSQHYSTTFKKLKSALTIAEILIFPGLLSFFHDMFQIFKIT